MRQAGTRPQTRRLSEALSTAEGASESTIKARNFSAVRMQQHELQQEQHEIGQKQRQKQNQKTGYRGRNLRLRSENQNTENQKGRTSNENIHNRRDNHCTPCFDAAFESILRPLR